MSYHISLFKNESSHNVVTANPVCNGDTYFIQAAGERIPGKNVLIETGNWSTYDAAFPHANFIYVGSNAYCFWDDGESQIKGSSEYKRGHV